MTGNEELLSCRVLFINFLRNELSRTAAGRFKADQALKSLGDTMLGVIKLKGNGLAGVAGPYMIGREAGKGSGACFFFFSFPGHDVPIPKFFVPH